MGHPVLEQPPDSVFSGHAVADAETRNCFFEARSIGRPVMRDTQSPHYVSGREHLLVHPFSRLTIAEESNHLLKEDGKGNVYNVV